MQPFQWLYVPLLKTAFVAFLYCVFYLFIISYLHLFCILYLYFFVFFDTRMWSVTAMAPRYKTGREMVVFFLLKTRIVGKYVHFIRERGILFWPCYIQELRIPNHFADSLGDLIDHIGHLPTSLLLQIALLASSIVLSWYHHQSESHQQGLVCTWIGPIDQYNRPDPRTPGSNKNYHEIFISV